LPLLEKRGNGMNDLWIKYFLSQLEYAYFSHKRGQGI
jgi:hypothetical protein